MGPIKCQTSRTVWQKRRPQISDGKKKNAIIVGIENLCSSTPRKRPFVPFGGHYVLVLPTKFQSVSERRDKLSKILAQLSTQ
jgi:hypothetical protein